MTTSKQEASCHLCTYESEQPKKCSCCNFQTMSTAHTAGCRPCVISNGEKHGPKKIIFQPIELKRRNLKNIFFNKEQGSRMFAAIAFPNNVDNLTGWYSRSISYCTNELYQILLNTLLFFIDYSEVNIDEHNNCWDRHLQDAISKFPSDLIEKIIISTIETYYNSKNYLNFIDQIDLSCFYSLVDFKTHPQLFEFDTEEEAQEFSKRIEDKLRMITLVVRAPLKEQYHTLYEHVVVHGNGFDEEAREKMTCFNHYCDDCLEERQEILDGEYDLERLKNYGPRSDIPLVTKF